MAERDHDPSVTGNPSTATQPETVRVRVRLLVNADGKWAAYSWTDATDDDADSVLYDMMGGEAIDTARVFYLVADIPLPQTADIAASVEACPAPDASAQDTGVVTDEIKG